MEVKKMRDEDMLNIACWNIKQIFRDVPINIDTYYHVERGKHNRVKDAYIDITIDFQIDQYSLHDVEKVMVKIKDQIQLLENGRGKQ